MAKSNSHKIGILGGTFNPIHLAHLQLAQDALEENDLDKVLFIPAGHPNFKKNIKLVDKYERLKMVELAIENENNFLCSDYEIRKDSYSYTIDTIEYLQGKNPEDSYHFICGEDSFFSVEKWYRASDLKEKMSFLIARRSKDLDDYDLIPWREKGYRVSLFDSVFLDISSTIIRRRIRDGKNCRFILPESVNQYIEKKGFYVD